MKKIQTHTRRIVFLLALLFLVWLPAQAQRQERSVQGWKPLHYDVELNFDEQLSGFTSARTRISVEVLSQLSTRSIWISQICRSIQSSCRTSLRDSSELQTRSTFSLRQRRNGATNLR